MCNFFKKNVPVEEAEKEVMDRKQEMIDVVDRINKYLEKGDIQAEIVIRKIKHVADESKK